MQTKAENKDVFKETEIGFIPEDWEVTKISDLTKTKAGGTPSTFKKEYWDGNIPWINSGALKDNRIREATKYITKLGLENSVAKILPKKTVLIALTGATTGKVGFLELECSTNQSVVGILPNNNFIPEYLFYHLIFLRDKVLELKYGAAQPHINKGLVDNLLVVLPSLPEQQRIGSILSKIQQAIEQQDKIIETTRNLKKSLMQKLFTEGVRHTELKNSMLGRISKNWETVELNEVITLAQYGLSIKGEKLGRYSIIRMNNLENGRILTDDLQYVNLDDKIFQHFRLVKGDILFNRTNSIDLVGKTALFDMDDDFVFASYLIRLKVMNEKVLPQFIGYYLNWNETQRRLKGLATRAVGQSNISATRLRTLVISLPTITEQQAIAETLLSVDKKIEAEEKRKSMLQRLFKTMLNRLMTGEIRVKDLDLGVSDVN